MGLLVIRRIPGLGDSKRADVQDLLFELFRYHSFFATVNKRRFDTVVTDQVHRKHAIIERNNAKLKNGALAYMPSGVFNANVAWLGIAEITHNLMRADNGLIGRRISKVRAQALRTRIIGIPTQLAHGARKLIPHLPATWTWAQEFSQPHLDVRSRSRRGKPLGVKVAAGPCRHT